MEKKIAYLIACHKNINQVARLVRRLSSANSYIFIHFDKKYMAISGESFDFKMQKIMEGNNVYKTNKRIHGELNRRSIVDITILLIKKAKEIEKKNKFISYTIIFFQVKIIHWPIYISSIISYLIHIQKTLWIVGQKEVMNF